MDSFWREACRRDLAYQQIYSLANKSIYIVDNYISLKTLVLFKHAKQNIEVTIFSANKNKALHKLEFEDFCKEYPGLKINLKTTGNKHHDRFIVLDYKTTDEKMYLSGASSKDAGKKISSISKMLDPNLFHPVIDELLKNPTLVLWFVILMHNFFSTTLSVPSTPSFSSRRITLKPEFKSRS